MIRHFFLALICISLISFSQDDIKTVREAHSNGILSVKGKEVICRQQPAKYNGGENTQFSIKIGEWEYFYQSGQKRAVESYLNHRDCSAGSIPHGWWLYFDELGALSKTEEYRYGILWEADVEQLFHEREVIGGVYIRGGKRDTIWYDVSLHEKEYSMGQTEPIVSDSTEMMPIDSGVNYTLRQIQFEFGRATLLPSSYPELNKLLNILKSQTLSIVIMGHTDNVGSEEYNLQLSHDRARAIYSWLIEQGVEEHRLSFQGFGATQPVTSNATEEGRALNRRVEFRIISGD